MGSGTEVLARLRLVQGHSDSELREFISARGQALLTIGSDAACDWCVRETGVAPVHFSLHWDGTVLRVSDTHGAGSIRVDGMPLGREWRSLPVRARIEFGRAAVVVETSSESPEPETQGQRNQRNTLPELPPLNERGARFSSSGSIPAPALSATMRQVGLDQRTLQGSAPAQAVSVSPTRQISGPPSTPAPSHPSVVPSVAPAPARSQPSGGFRDERAVSASTPPPEQATSIVMYHPDESTGRAHHNAASEQSISTNQMGRIPRAVVVLSPIHTGQSGPPEAAERTAATAQHKRPLAGWRPITLGVLALGAGYLSWVYLLYHL